MTHRCSSVAARQHTSVRHTTLSCISNIEVWMCSNRLKLNPAKTEFLWCTTHRRLHLIDESPFIIGNATIQPAMSVRNLAVLMDHDLPWRSYIVRLTGACFRALRQAWAIRRPLTMNASRMLVNSAVLSRIDYCNCIYTVLPDFKLDNLHQVMSTAMRVIFRHRKYDHISDVLQDLHWLRVPQRIEFKLSHCEQGPTHPCTIVSSWSVDPSYCGSSQATATLFIRQQSCRTEASIRVWQACFCLRWTAHMEQPATNDEIIYISSSLKKTTEDIFSDNATNFPDFSLLVVALFFCVTVKCPAIF